MKQKKFLVVDINGINSRSYAKLVGEANNHKCFLTLKFGNESADLKSIMNVMALIIKHNESFEIIADGTDEEKAIEKLEELMRTIKLI